MKDYRFSKHIRVNDDYNLEANYDEVHSVIILQDVKYIEEYLEDRRINRILETLDAMTDSQIEQIINGISDIANRNNIAIQKKLAKEIEDKLK